MNSYDRSIITVLTGIEQNLEFVTIDDLIELSGYSYYHFHRLFKTYTGESIKKYIKRLQLEKAKRKLKSTDENMTSLAIEAGFHLPTSFNKAFKGHFDTNPSECKRAFDARRSEYQYIEPMRFETLNPFDVTAIRYVGECQFIDSTFAQIINFAKENELFDDSLELFGITYDDPEVTDEVYLRYDVCIRTDDEIVLNTKDTHLFKKTVDGGRYAVFHHEGDATTLMQTYNAIVGRWLYENDIKLRYVPVLHRVLSDKEHLTYADFTIELFIPIE